ncbi:MAG: outer membrane beta-barrel protein [Bacteroidia bacterium]|nr:outer membrane beta-barrel protein [Bacteroidia bacterium]
MKIKHFLLSTLILASFSTSSLMAQSNKIGVVVEAGYGAKLNKSDFNGAQIYITPVYNLSKKFSVGAGVGLIFNHRNNTIFKESQSLLNIPVYGSVEYIFSGDNKIMPFINLKAGYGIASKKYQVEDIGKLFPVNDNIVNVKNMGGVFLSPAVGIAYSINKSLVRLSLAYDYQKMDVVFSDNANHTIKSKDSNSTITLKLGWSF